MKLPKISYLFNHKKWLDSEKSGNPFFWLIFDLGISRFSNVPVIGCIFLSKQVCCYLLFIKNQQNSPFFR